MTDTRKVKDNDVEYHSNKIVFFKEFHHDDEDLEFYGYLALEVAMNPDGSYKYHDEARFVGGNIAAGGTVVYEDVTNVDSVGIVTAGGGLYVGRTSIGATFTTAGDAILAGVVTATSFSGDGSDLSGIESWNQQDTWLYGGG